MCESEGKMMAAKKKKKKKKKKLIPRSDGHRETTADEIKSI
jgi:hypothetical protein